jgi:GrpB-like predicted nucleotidyltransferase (UPF0157 family)
MRTDEELAALTVGEMRPHDGPISLHDYDPAWPTLFGREAERIRGGGWPRDAGATSSTTRTPSRT